jgi:hypothetical protein
MRRDEGSAHRGAGHKRPSGTFAHPRRHSTSASYVYSMTGVYTPALTVTDDDEGSATSALEAYLVAYDPDGGFVTVGGWINSGREKDP